MNFNAEMVFLSKKGLLDPVFQKIGRMMELKIVLTVLMKDHLQLQLHFSAVIGQEFDWSLCSATVSRIPSSLHLQLRFIAVFV